MAHRDLSKLRELDTGTQLLADRFAIADAACHCSGTPYYWTKGPRHLNTLTVYVPHQTSYPLFFLAQILSGTQSANGAVTAALIIIRSSADEPWRIASAIFDTGYFPAADPLPPPVAMAGGYDTDPDNPAADVATTWPAMLTSYYTYFKTHGEPPANAPFLPGALTTGSGLERNREGVTRRGVTYHYKFVVAHGPWIVNTSDGTIACSDIYEVITRTPAKPRDYFLQPANMKTLGAEIAPGHYKRVITTYQWPTCIHSTADHLSVSGTTNPFPVLQTAVRTSARR
jgi:hypothetical protein